MNKHAGGPARDVEDRWTLRDADRALLGNKTGITRLGFAVLLKLFQAGGRFPRRPEDVPAAAVEAIAGQVGVAAVAWQGYDRALVHLVAGGRVGSSPDCYATPR